MVEKMEKEEWDEVRQKKSIICVCIYIYVNVCVCVCVCVVMESVPLSCNEPTQALHP